jgi:polyisoprenoid-binding protein YceI
MFRRRKFHDLIQSPKDGRTAMKPFVLFAFVLLLAPAALAQHQTFVVNPDGSEVKMTLNTTRELVNGTFHVQSGVIDFDPGTAKIGGNVVVAAGTGKTGNDIRDKRMNNVILHVQQYATVTFSPRTYTGTIASTGDSTIQVTGVFTLLGTPHDLTIPIQIHRNGSNCIANAHFVIPYVQWGLKDPSFLLWKAEKQVDMDLNLVGHIS